MGSSISVHIAETVIQSLEKIALPQINRNLWVRYVDGTFVILERMDVESTHGLINDIFRGIKFTM